MVETRIVFSRSVFEFVIVHKVLDPPIPTAVPLGHGHPALTVAERAVEEGVQGQLFENAQIVKAADHAHKRHIEVIGQRG